MDCAETDFAKGIVRRKQPDEKLAEDITFGWGLQVAILPAIL
jgi:hypothetical protein